MVDTAFKNSRKEEASCGDFSKLETLPRFGAGLAACRSVCLKKHKNMAKKFTRLAKRSDNVVDKRPKVNKAWSDEAQLKSVMEYLSR